MQMDDAEDRTLTVDDHQRRDLLLFHHTERGGSECVGWDGLRICCDAITGSEVHHIFAFVLEQAAQVAVTDHPQQALALEQSSATSAAAASVESLEFLPEEYRSSQVIVINAAPMRLIMASRRTISSVSPLEESATTTSPRTNMPRSPCMASAGCINKEG